jgi:hypothetical protein
VNHAGSPPLAMIIREVRISSIDDAMQDRLLSGVAVIVRRFGPQMLLPAGIELLRGRERSWIMNKCLANMRQICFGAKGVSRTASRYHDTS